MRAVWLGRIGYRPAAALQESLRQRILGGDEQAETLLLLEHDPVVTLGRAAQAANVLASEEALARRGVERVASTRGGDVTYHGPGQLVAYPVMRLGKGVLAHVEAMAEAAIAVAGAWGIEARFRRDCPGVWVGESQTAAACGTQRKLAAFGVHVSRRVAIHGVALNVTTGLDAFDLIVPCGLAGTRATSIFAEAGRAPTVEEAGRAFAAAFARVLGRTLDFAAPDSLHDLTLLSRSVAVE